MKMNCVWELSVQRERPPLTPPPALLVVREGEEGAEEFWARPDSSVDLGTYLV